MDSVSKESYSRDKGMYLGNHESRQNHRAGFSIKYLAGANQNTGGVYFEREGVYNSYLTLLHHGERVSFTT